MAGYMTPVTKQFLLDVMVGKATAFALPRSTYLGLATTLPLEAVPTLANISEVVTPGYARVVVPWDAATAAEPVFVDNTSDLQLGPVTEDMVPAFYAFLTDSATGNALTAPVVTDGGAAAGGAFAAGTYYWVVTAINSRGETIASNEISKTLTLNQKETLNWGAVSGATGYKVYRGTVSGIQTVRVATLGAVTTYEDTGTAGTAATVPAENSASVGDILYVWELIEPVRALASKPIFVPASALVVE